VERAAKPSLAIGLTRFVVLGALTVLFCWQFRHPILRFSWDFANTAAGLAIALTLPWFAVVQLGRLRRWWSTALTVIVAMPVLIYSFVAIAASGFNLIGITLQPGWKGSRIVTYLTNGGATTDYGLIVRQERAIFPGVLLVRKIDDLYPCAELTVTSTGDGISVTPPTPRSCADLQSTRAYSLKPHVYF
jgi:hypothetical protein